MVSGTPNPYAFANAKYPLPAEHTSRYAKGIIHGDLHGHNVLFKKISPYMSEYYLIDLALSKKETYLLYDHAYFELSHLLSIRENHIIVRWLAILNAISSITIEDIKKVATRVKDSDDAGIFQFVKKVREQVFGWISSCEKNRKPTLEGQFFLARIAVGLNFLNKKLSNQFHLFALFYAATNLKLYLKFFDLKWPKEGQTLHTDINAPQLRTDQWRTVWNQCDHFNKQKGKYILIAGPEVRKIDKSNLSILGRLPWSLVLDFDPKGEEEGMLEAIEAVISRYRGFHLTTPEDKVQINYHHATNWLMVCGLDRRQDTVTHDFQMWRRKHLRNIRKIFEQLYSSMAPENITLLVL